MIFNNSPFAKWLLKAVMVQYFKREKLENIRILENIFKK